MNRRSFLRLTAAAPVAAAGAMLVLEQAKANPVDSMPAAMAPGETLSVDARLAELCAKIDKLDTSGIDVSISRARFAWPDDDQTDYHERLLHYRRFG